jgi:hypothetical protein
MRENSAARGRLSVESKSIISKNPGGWFHLGPPPATKATALSFLLSSAASLCSAVPVEGENASRTPNNFEPGRISYDDRVIKTPLLIGRFHSRNDTIHFQQISQTVLIFLQKEWTI